MKTSGLDFSAKTVVISAKQRDLSEQAFYRWIATPNTAGSWKRVLSDPQSAEPYESDLAFLLGCR